MLSNIINFIELCKASSEILCSGGHSDYLNLYTKDFWELRPMQQGWNYLKWIFQGSGTGNETWKCSGLEL